MRAISEDLAHHHEGSITIKDEILMPMEHDGNATANGALPG
jgi:hypothetical protein